MTMRMLWLVLGCLVAGACSPVPRDSDTTDPRPREDQDVEAIRELSRGFARALSSGDVDGILELTTADVVVMPPNSPAVEGADAAAALFEGIFAAVQLDERWEPREIVVERDLAFEWSRYDVTVTPVGGEPTQETGDNLNIASRQPDGSWKYSRMMWNRAAAR